MDSPLKKRLREMYGDLSSLDAVIVHAIAGKMFAVRCLSKLELDAVKALNIDAGAKLADFTYTKDDSCIIGLARALNEVDRRDLAVKLDPNVLRSLDGVSSTGRSGNDGDTSKGSNGLALSDKLKAASAYIKEHLTTGEVGKIVHELYANNHFELRDKEQLQATLGATNQASMLIDIIEKKSDKTIRYFLKILRDMNRDDIADRVETART